MKDCPRKIPKVYWQKRFGYWPARKRRPGLMAIFFGCLLVILLNASLLGQQSTQNQSDTSRLKMRLWTNSTGKIRLTARLIAIHDGKVVLRKEDQTEVSIAIGNLSVFDQRFIKPFGGRLGRVEAAPAMGSAETRLIVPDVNNSKKLKPAFVTHWEIEPDASEIRAEMLRDVTFIKTVPNLGSGATQKVSRILFSDDETSVLVQHDVVIDDRQETYIQMRDVVNGKTEKYLRLEESGRLGDLTDNYFVTLGKERIDFWHTKTLKHRAGWKMDEPLRNIVLLPSDLMASWTVAGRFRLWDIRQKKLIFEMDGYSKCEPAFSRGGRFVAVPLEKGAMLIRCADGKICGSVKLAAPVKELDFSPDGSRLAVSTFQSLAVFSMENGALESEFFHEQAGMGGLSWVDNENLLVNKRCLVNVGNQVEVWRYFDSMTDPRPIQTHYNRFWYGHKKLNQSSAGLTLIPVEIPDRHVQEVLSELGSNKYRVVAPGMKFRMEVGEIPLKDEQMEELRNDLKKKMEQNDFAIDPQSEYVIRIEAKVAEPQIAVYQSSAYFAKAVKFSPCICLVRIMKGNRLLWQNYVVAEPGPLIQLQRGESLSDYAKRASQPRPFLYRMIKIPRNISVLPDGKKYLGQSTLTSNGAKVSDDVP